MPSWPRVSFSRQHLVPTEIDQLHTDTVASMRQYFSPVSPVYSVRFAGYSLPEVTSALDASIEEHERAMSMSLLSAIEAAFRIDYLQRCYGRKRDQLSLALRQIHSNKGNKASLEDDILIAWRDCVEGTKAVVSDLKGAFRYRHWLAHGRYWVPKLGRKFDYHGIYTLAELVFDSFPLEGD